MSLRSTDAEKVEFLQTANKLLQSQIADLKRQLRQALAQVEIVDRALGDPGNTSSKVALDAYVQERVDRLSATMRQMKDEAVLAERKMWQSRESEEYRQALLKRAVEAEKRAEKAESNMAKAVLTESEWWAKRSHVLNMEENAELQQRLAANRAKVKK